MMRKKKSKIIKKSFTESDLYEPIHGYLVKHGYTVRSEVLDCDITAVKGDDLIVIELKKSFNASLLIQATQRQKITDSVYVAIPYPKEGIRNKKWRRIQHLLKRLELGLLLVTLQSIKPAVEIVFHPLPLTRQKSTSKKRAVLKEIDGRSGDYNQGGSSGCKIVTAYRENAIFIACCLEKYGPLAPRDLRKLGTGDKTQAILYNNHYDWFDRVEVGVYALKPSAMVQVKEFKELCDLYSKQIEKIEIEE